MSPAPDTAEAALLPDDVATLKALLLAERAAAAKLVGQNEHLRAIVKELQRALFGRRSEKVGHPDQLHRALEDLEQAIAEGEAEAEKSERVQQRRVNRGALPKHLPRHEVVIEPDDQICPGCGGEIHRIGEDVAERLDVTPAQFRVIVTRRLKYGCRACESAVVQAPAPARLIEGGCPRKPWWLMSWSQVLMPWPTPIRWPENSAYEIPGLQGSCLLAETVSRRPSRRNPRGGLRLPIARASKPHGLELHLG